MCVACSFSVHVLAEVASENHRNSDHDSPDSFAGDTSEIWLAPPRVIGWTLPLMHVTRLVEDRPSGLGKHW